MYDSVLLSTKNWNFSIRTSLHCKTENWEQKVKISNGIFDFLIVFLSPWEEINFKWMRLITFRKILSIEISSWWHLLRRLRHLHCQQTSFSSANEAIFLQGHWKKEFWEFARCQCMLRWLVLSFSAVLVHNWACWYHISRKIAAGSSPPSWRLVKMGGIATLYPSGRGPTPTARCDTFGHGYLFDLHGEQPSNWRRGDLRHREYYTEKGSLETFQKEEEKNCKKNLCSGYKIQWATNPKAACHPKE